MLKLQITLIAILIACVAFVSCDRAQKMLEPAAEDITATDDKPMDMTMDMMKMMDSTMYMSWASVALPAPAMTVEEAAAAMNPGGTGAIHGEGSRTVYINDAGAVANKAGTAYPAGTMIVKVIMDDTDTFVAKKALMMKSDDPMYTGHNGWVYKKYARSSADGEYMQVKGSNLEDAGNGCHGCHAKAANDSVFVSVPMDDTDTDVDTDAEGTGTDAGPDAGDTDAGEATLKTVPDADGADTEAETDMDGTDTDAGADTGGTDAGEVTLETVPDAGGTDAGDTGENTEENGTEQ